MKLLSLKMINARSHKESFIEFHDGITVIFGKTGSGKSTILMGIYYALFGSMDVSSSEIMARNAKKMIVELKFMQNNDEYVVMRGLKKTGTSIIIDSENTKVMKNGVQLNALGRSGDITSIISEVLGFSNDSKPNLMFQVLSYTKQDNIRNLIDMRKEERQEFIDKILQLSKYKAAFENLKPLIDKYYFEYEKIIQIIEFLKAEQESEKKLEEKISGLREKIIDNEKKLEVIDSAIESKSNELKKNSVELDELKKKSEQALICGQRKKHFEELIERLKKEKQDIEVKIFALEPNISGRSENMEALEKELGNEASKIRVIDYRIEKLKAEKSQFSGLKGACPTCKQEINETHMAGLKSKNEEELNIISEEKKFLEEKVFRIRELLESQKKFLEAKKELDNLKSSANIWGGQIAKAESELNALPIQKIECFKEKIDEAEAEFKKLSDKINDLRSKKAAIESSNFEIKSQIDSIEKESGEKKEKMAYYAKKAGEKSRIKSTLDFLSMIRANVKDIRQIIRSRFLNDFKNSFAKKFEEIRSNDNEYYVEINSDYEPIAYSLEGASVPINHLSGGEKTSAALAYRLALSDLAGEMNNLMPAELLILDEPTSGFDNDDVKALPDALSSLSSIPQIIIVTHEELLKEVANNCVEIKKAGGFSKIFY
ncbi:MAG: AAA family ATPase [Candidatus Nanoarchaeia archaeon]|nr:AAA family ATPase [Candidatus Nanoarchaeia archaeon]